jgi:hypothetical protein
VTVAVVAVIGVLALVAVLLATGGGKLPAPGNVEAVTTPDGVNLSWDAVKSAKHYTVVRDNRVISGNVHGTSYTDKAGASAPHSYSVYAVGSRGKRGEKSQSVSTVPQPADSPTPQATSPSSASPAPPSTSDQDLANSLPPDVADAGTCMHYAKFETPVTVAAVSCAPAATSTAGSRPKRIYAYRDRTPAAFRQHFSRINKGFQPGNGDCNKPPSRGTWWFTQAPKTIVGSTLCYVDKAAKAPTIQWTYDAAGIAIVAVGSSLDARALVTWWINVGLRLQ